MNICSVCGKAPVVGWGYCKKHYRAFNKYGDPLYSANLRGVPLEDRVVVDEATGCLLWTGSTNTSGYGIIRAEGENVAHRAAYRKYVGPIPEGAHVLHTCDRPACVWPEHLFLGSHEDNMLDMKLKGRSRGAVGSINAAAKITESQAINIMCDPRPQGVIAGEYGLTRHMIDKIQNGSAWKHVFKKKYKAERLSQRPKPLTKAQVARIKKDPRTQMQIADAFGTSQSTVSLIKRGKYAVNHSK
jgi:HNH endonuclease